MTGCWCCCSTILEETKSHIKQKNSGTEQHENATNSEELSPSRHDRTKGILY
jgi:hypothetical protein